MSNILYENGFPIKAIVNGKLVDVQEVRHGRWIKSGNSYKCSVCGGTDVTTGKPFKYCPTCGAKMDEEENK